MNVLLAVFIGGGLGSLARFGISKAVIAGFQTSFPLATLLSNVLSSIVLGLAVGVFRQEILEHRWLQSFVLIGFCGGFSTFSTFSYETFALLKDGHTGYAILNVVLSITLCTVIIFTLYRNTGS